MKKLLIASISIAFLLGIAGPSIGMGIGGYRSDSASLRQQTPASESGLILLAGRKKEIVRSDGQPRTPRPPSSGR